MTLAEWNISHHVRKSQTEKPHMKKKFIFSISVMFLAVLLAGLVLTGCSQTPGTGDGGTTPPAEEPGGTDNENPSEPGDEPDPQKLDLVLFIGQSNMAGRGDSTQAVQVGEGHAFEFRAISDPPGCIRWRSPSAQRRTTARAASAKTARRARWYPLSARATTARPERRSLQSLARRAAKRSISLTLTARPIGTPATACGRRRNF